MVARDARLSAVLGDLARAFGFELSFKSQRDPVMNLDVSGTPADVVTAIARSQNTSLAHAPDSRCATGMRLANVWLLPATGAPATAPAVTPLAPRNTLVEAASTYDGNYLLLTVSPAFEQTQ